MQQSDGSDASVAAGEPLFTAAQVAAAVEQAVRRQSLTGGYGARSDGGANEVTPSQLLNKVPGYD